jgi:predicted transcriptional regulator
MEILEILITTTKSISITEIATNVRVKHQKAKQLLESMERINWIISNTSMQDDLRFKDDFEISEEGTNVLKIYYDKIEQIFQELEKSG